MLFDQEMKRILRIVTKKDGNITFDELVKKNFITNEGKATVKIHLRDEDQLYSEFSNKEVLNPAILEYLEIITMAIPNDYPLVIKFILKNADKVDKKKISNLFKRHFWISFEEKEHKLKKDLIYAGFLFVTGVAILLGYQYAASNNLIVLRQAISVAFFEEFALIVSWVFLWEAVRHVFIGRKNRVEAINNDEQIASAEIVFEELVETIKQEVK
jgi:hypothetical protein